MISYAHDSKDVVPARTALITGINGQDGTYLAELLLGKGYRVHGMLRRSSSSPDTRLRHLDPRQIVLHEGDMTDAGALHRLVREVEPDEVYNLAAQSHVHVSFEQPEHTADVIALGTVRLLEAVVQSGRTVRFYQASTSEMFGLSPAPQDETTPFLPTSPYACAKLAAHWTVACYRRAYGLYACSGILFNHESPRRGEQFVTRKVTRGIASILAGRADTVRLGNLHARRDWGHASDYVRAMWLMLQQERPDDYVIATGVDRSVGDFVEAAFGMAGLDWRRHVEMDLAYVRPSEVRELRGDASRARRDLGWRPRVAFADLVREMLESDLRSEGLDPTRVLAARAA